jgi:hypothetical protein
MANHRRGTIGRVAQAGFQSLTAGPTRQLPSELEEIYRSAPWILMVYLGIQAGWTVGQIMTLLAMLLPVIIICDVTTPRQA